MAKTKEIILFRMPEQQKYLRQVQFREFNKFYSSNCMASLCKNDLGDAVKYVYSYL